MTEPAPSPPDHALGDDARAAQRAAMLALTPAERLRLLDRLCRDLTRLAVAARRT